MLLDWNMDMKQFGVCSTQTLVKIYNRCAMVSRTNWWQDRFIHNSSKKLDHVSKRNNLFSIGGCDKTLKAAEETDLLENIRKKTLTFDYDIVVMNVTPLSFSPIRYNPYKWTDILSHSDIKKLHHNIKITLCLLIL